MRALSALILAGLAGVQTGAALEVPHLLGAIRSDVQSEAGEDFVRAREAAPPLPFMTEEAALKKILAEAGGRKETEQAARRLAQFYHRYQLNVEALAAMQLVDPAPDDPDARFIGASAQYSLGRFADALNILGGPDELPEGRALALYGMTLARLGAYAKAGEALAAAGKPPSENLLLEFHLMRAASALALGKTEAAAAALHAMQPVDARAPLRREAEFYEALLLFARGDSGRATKIWQGLARADDAIGARAALALATHEADAGAISRVEALEKARAISLRWRGGAVEREALFLIGGLLGDAPEGFETMRRLAEEHAPADTAERARETLTVMVARLVADDKRLSSAAKARLFYEMIDFAPPGAQGDALIRAVAGRLQALDLLPEAAELLEHQVFNRLRGKERAVVAADLAEVYLDDGRPGEARRVISATRIAGLDGKNNRRRLLLEARALAVLDDGEAALALLDGAEAPEITQLRAEIFWRRSDWRRAAETYRAVATAAAAPLDAQGRVAVLRAATAFVLAKNEKGLSAFNAEMSQKIGADALARLLDALTDEAETAGGMDAYRLLYVEPGRSG